MYVSLGYVHSLITMFPRTDNTEFRVPFHATSYVLARAHNKTEGEEQATLSIATVVPAESPVL